MTFAKLNIEIENLTRKNISKLCAIMHPPAYITEFFAYHTIPSCQ